MSTANRVIKNTGFLYAKMGITMFISLYTTRLILNSLGASDFGIFNIVGGAISMLGFLNAAMASATQRFMSYSEGEGNREKQKSIFNVSFILHLGISIVVGISLLIAGYFFFNGILNIPQNRILAAKVVYGSLIISTMFTVMTVPYDAAMNAHENMKYYAVIGVFEAILKLAVAFVCVYTSNDKLIVYGVLMACIPLITLTIMRFYCHRHYIECIIAPYKYWDKNLIKEMTSFAGWNFINSATSMVSTYGQNIILNIFFNTTINAAFSIANQVNGQLQVLSQNMLKAINPTLSKSYGANNQILLEQSTLMGAKYSCFLYSLIAIPIFIQAPYILKLWLIEIPDWCIIFIRLQIIKSFIEFQFITILSAISATGKIRTFMIYSSTLYALQIPIQYIVFSYEALPYYIYITSIIISNIIVYAIALYFINKYINLSYKKYFQSVSIPILKVTILSFTFEQLYCYLYSVDSIIKLALFIIFSLIIYMTIAYLTATSSNEKKNIYLILQQLKKRLNNNGKNE